MRQQRLNSMCVTGQKIHASIISGITAIHDLLSERLVTAVRFKIRPEAKVRPTGRLHDPARHASPITFDLIVFPDAEETSEMGSSVVGNGRECGKKPFHVCA